MGDVAEAIRPIWRTPLAAVLGGWMAIVIGATLSSGRLMEIVPGEALPVLAVAVYAAPLPILLGWSIWAMLREPTTAWLAPTIFLAFCGAFVPAFGPLLEIGTRLNFESRRAVYDAIVAEAVRTRALGGPDGAVTGVRDGVRYRFRADRPGEIDFIWTRSGAFAEGILYDSSPCLGRPGMLCADRGELLDGFYSHYRYIF
jgi:hypothetical protein